ncbi:MAG: hypothetical protein N3D15_01360 [Syntrophorhabdaceae bacterium]|nr:hypothetical protein [Syntrophorhabdaceae bacterium]
MRYITIIVTLFLFNIIFTPDALTQELTKEEALKILTESLKSEKITDLTKYYQRNGILNTFKPENGDLNKYKALEEKGFILLKPLTDSNITTDGEKRYGITFTEKSEPYMIKKDDEIKDKALISLGKAEKIDITEIKPVAPKEYKAEFLIGYRLTPFGEILLGKRMIFEKKDDAFFEHRDDGWKIKFKTSF